MEKMGADAPTDPRRDELGAPTGRDTLVPIRPTDRVVIARVVATLALALITLSFADGATSILIAMTLVAHAVIQPLITLIWTRQDHFRQAQLFFDIGVGVVFVLVAPAYFWLVTIVLAALLANHAVMAPVRHYAPAAVVATLSTVVVGIVQDVEHAWRAVGVTAVIAVGHGITGHGTRSSMRSSRRDLLHAVGAARSLTHLTDLRRGVVDVAGSIEEVVGWSREEWLELDHRTIIHPADIDAFWLDDTTVEVGDVIDRTARVRSRDGRWIWLRDVSRVVEYGNRKHVRGFCIDVTDQQTGLDRVTTEASTDALTGLKNRRWLRSELVRREGEGGHHLVLIDLDRFKDVNDTLGHEAGDELLEVVADRLTRCMRPTDSLARLGGDEFAVIMDGMRDSAAVAAAVDRLAFEVASPVEISGVTVTVSMSAGIVSAASYGADASAMLRFADIAMYSAKRAGLSSLVFDDELERRSERRAALSAGLADALSTGRLGLYFQPIVDVRTGRVVSAEGLARWEHEDFGLLQPDAFLEVILMSERSGEFTRAMVSQAIAAAATLGERGEALPIAVNLPLRTLEDPEFESWFVKRCAAGGVDPAQLTFEVPERDIHLIDAAATAINNFSHLGVTISVDDFGAGHATFERLKWRTVSQLKLDRELIREAAHDIRQRSILRSVLDLARDLSYDVVVEGVEREDQLELLREFGCPFAQGFLFGEATPIDGLQATIAARRESPPATIN